MKINGVIAMLKKKAPKIIQINDILQWYDNGELELSPKYQRNSVWNERRCEIFSVNSDLL